ncbi:MAG: tyrosine recombinase [Candidatus Nanopelagicaceae bacterium]
MREKVHANLPAEAVRFLDHLAVERGASRNTLTSYKHDLVEFFLSHPTLSGDNVSDYVANLRRNGRSAATVARKISTLRSLEDFLSLHDPSRPGWKVDVKTRGRKLPTTISYKEIQTLIESPDDSVKGLRDRAILECLYAGGMRVSECINLNLDQFLSDEKGTHFIRIIGKGSKERMIPIGEQAFKACNDYLVRARPTLAKNPSEPAFFLNQRGQRLSRQGVWGIIKSAARRVGFDGRLTPHTLRHAFATHMLERGADVRSVQELLGHASVVTTQIYTAITNETLRETHSISHPRAR